MAVMTIRSALAERVEAADLGAVLESSRTARRARAAYAGGLPAELQSAAARRTADRAAHHKTARAEYLRGIGRRIDLRAILRQRSKDGTPLWAIVDPAKPIGPTNGTHDRDGTLGIGGRWQRIWHEADPDRTRVAFMPTGLPPLPERVRQIVTDRTVRRRAAWVGVLYQPEAWREVEPDPAVIVEWGDRPGEYYCLALWGEDRGVISEWLD